MTRRIDDHPPKLLTDYFFTCSAGPMQLGRETLQWDPDREEIIGDEAAAAMLSRPYRDPWRL